MVSVLVFKKPLDFKSIEKLELAHNEKLKNKKGWGYWFWGVTNKSNATNKTEKKEMLSPRVEPVREIKIKKSLRPTSEQLVF
jgi:hypothetical protein